MHTVHSENTVCICTMCRLQVHFGGRLVYCHERDEGWSVSGYLSSLQKQHHLSPRDIYWRWTHSHTHMHTHSQHTHKHTTRLWGLVNCLTCSGCGRVFQCRDLSSCYHHSQPALSGRPSTGPPVHICCGSPPANTSPFPLPQVRISHWVQTRSCYCVCVCVCV